MKRAAIMLMLVLAGCGEAIHGGTITGKFTKIDKGTVFTDNVTLYYLTVKKNDQTGEVEVTQEAWDQASSGMTWPFEVKK